MAKFGCGRKSPERVPWPKILKVMIGFFLSKVFPGCQVKRPNPLTTRSMPGFQKAIVVENVFEGITIPFSSLSLLTPEHKSVVLMKRGSVGQDGKTTTISEGN